MAVKEYRKLNQKRKERLQWSLPMSLSARSYQAKEAQQRVFCITGGTSGSTETRHWVYAAPGNVVWLLEEAAVFS